MKSEKSFLDILEERIRKDLKPQTIPVFQREEPSYSNNEYAYLAYLLGKNSPLQTKRHVIHTYGLPPARPKKPHRFNPAQLNAFNRLKQWAGELHPGFTMRELKKAFRQAAMRTHPDRGGTSDTFQTVQWCYIQLREVLCK